MPTFLVDTGLTAEQLSVLLGDRATVTEQHTPPAWWHLQVETRHGTDVASFATPAEALRWIVDIAADVLVDWPGWDDGDGPADVEQLLLGHDVPSDEDVAAVRTLLAEHGVHVDVATHDRPNNFGWGFGGNSDLPALVTAHRAGRR